MGHYDAVDLQNRFPNSHEELNCNSIESTQQIHLDNVDRVIDLTEEEACDLDTQPIDWTQEDKKKCVNWDDPDTNIT